MGCGVWGWVAERQCSGGSSRRMTGPMRRRLPPVPERAGCLLVTERGGAGTWAQEGGAGPWGGSSLGRAGCLRGGSGVIKLLLRSHTGSLRRVLFHSTL